MPAILTISPVCLPAPCRWGSGLGYCSKWSLLRQQQMACQCGGTCTCWRLSTAGSGSVAVHQHRCWKQMPCFSRHVVLPCIISTNSSLLWIAHTDALPCACCLPCCCWCLLAPALTLGWPPHCAPHNHHIFIVKLSYHHCQQLRSR